MKAAPSTGDNSNNCYVKGFVVVPEKIGPIPEIAPMTLNTTQEHQNLNRSTHTTSIASCVESSQRL